VEDRATLESDLSAYKRLYSRAGYIIPCPTFLSALLVALKAINSADGFSASGGWK